MAKKKKKNTKIHIKPEVRNLAIFIAILFILGLIFMNFMFTIILILGILFIMWISNIVGKKRKRKWVRVVFNILAILFLLAAIAGVGVVAWFLNYVVDHAPEFNEDALTMTQTTKIYDAQGVEIAELGTEKREIIKYNQLNEVLVDALVATEDSRFFQHNGFDAPRFIVASMKQAMGQSDAGGASTLTMQVAKNSYNAENANETKGFKGILRKFTDIYMAVFKIEQNYSKQEIIEFYLNNHFLGNNAYGIEQAALTYFNKHANELNLAEASLLIGMFQAPGTYDPFKNPEAAQARRATVLKLMYNHGYISEEEREIANAIPVSKMLDTQKTAQKYWSYINTVVEEAQKRYGANPHTTSMLIYTNMNSEYQQAVDDLMSGRTYDWDNPDVQAGIAVVEAKSGKITAIGAGRNQEGVYSPTNYATQTVRQIGSTAKPIFDYAPGIEYNNWSTGKLFDDSKYYYSTGQEIRNSDRGYMGIITLRTALAQSRNVPALKAFQQTSQEDKLKMVRSLGITIEKESDQGNYLHEAYSVGAFNGSNPMEMAGAYAAFANGGYFTEPYTISKIKFRDTGEVVEHEEENKQVMSSATAFMITDCLKTAVTNGLSSAAKINGVNVAAKTGTTNYTAQIRYQYGLGDDALNDAWIIGYDPETVIALWYGYDPISTKYWSNPSSALRNRKNIFNQLGNKIFKKNGQDFAVPDTVVKVGVEATSDVNREPKLPSAYTPQEMIIYEWFKKGTEPTEVSAAYQRLSDVPSLTGSYNDQTKTVTLKWGAGAPPEEDLSSLYGELGYKVYMGSSFMGFTRDTSFTINNVDNPNTTYRVAQGYSQSGNVDSAGTVTSISYKDPANYKASLNVDKSKTYNVGAALDSHDANPKTSDVSLTKDGKAVTPNVSISITDSAGNKVAGISTSSPEVFKISYNISYGISYKETLTRTVTVKSSGGSGGENSNSENTETEPENNTGDTDNSNDNQNTEGDT